MFEATRVYYLPQPSNSVYKVIVREVNRETIGCNKYESPNYLSSHIPRQQDDLTRAWFISLSLTRWLGVRMNAIASVFVTAVLMCCLSVPNVGVGEPLDYFRLFVSPIQPTKRHYTAISCIFTNRSLARFKNFRHF